MVQINFAQKQVNAKIVYYGPGMSGKTTNLEIIHQRAPKANRGELTSISTDGDRTLFFDFMPLDLGTVAGMRTCFQIYTVPGQVYYNSTRKLVLQGVDGVIFVADSSASMMEENLESLRNLENNLAEYGRSVDDVAVVIQFNKRDLPDALPLEELNAKLNPHGVPSFEGVAHTGQGVFPTLKALAACVIENIHNQQRAALSPAGGGSNRRPTRGGAEAAPEVAQPAVPHQEMVAADAPAAPLPTRAEPASVPATMAAAQAPARRPEPPAAAQRPPAQTGGLRLSEPQSTPESRAAASGASAGAPPAEQAPPGRPRRPVQQEAPSAPPKRPAARPAAKPAKQQAKQAKGGGHGKQPQRGMPAKAQSRRDNQSGQSRRESQGGQSRRGSKSAQQDRRRSAPRPTPVAQKGSRSTVLTAVIVIASVGIGAVLGSLVLGAL